MTSLRTLGAFLGLTTLACIAGGQSTNGRATLREVLREARIPLDARALPDADARITSYATENAPDLFAIAYYRTSPDSLDVATLDRATRRWTHATLDLRHGGVLEADVGAVMAIHHSHRTVLVDTHINPSAGTVIVLSRSLVRVTTLQGWVLRVLPTDVVLYHRNSVHFAPTHWAELWTWAHATRRDTRLYPNAPWDSVRRAYVDTVRAIYKRVGPEWFRADNHDMDPERFDSRLGDTVVVATSGRRIAFTVTFGGGEGTPAETPTLDVAVVCRDVGASRSRCSEQPLADLIAKNPGRATADLLRALVGPDSDPKAFER